MRKISVDWNKIVGQMYVSIGKDVVSFSTVHKGKNLPFSINGSPVELTISMYSRWNNREWNSEIGDYVTTSKPKISLRPSVNHYRKASTGAVSMHASTLEKVTEALRKHAEFYLTDKDSVSEGKVNDIKKRINDRMKQIERYADYIRHERSQIDELKRELNGEPKKRGRPRGSRLDN